MMNILEKLQNLLNIEIKIDKSTHIHLDNSFNESYALDQDKKVLIVNPYSDELDSNEKEKVKEIFRDFVSQKGNKALEIGIPKTLEKISTYLQSDDKAPEGLLNFFKPLMNDEDFDVFESSYFIINSDINGPSEIPKLKKGIREDMVLGG